MPVYELHDFRKSTGEAERVTVVTRDEIDHFLGAHSFEERQEHLRWLRDRGTLVCNRGRLQQKIRRTPDWTTQEMAYVFRCQIDAVPKIRRRPPAVMQVG